MLTAGARDWRRGGQGQRRLRQEYQGFSLAGEDLEWKGAGIADVGRRELKATTALTLGIRSS